MQVGAGIVRIYREIRDRWSITAARTFPPYSRTFALACAFHHLFLKHLKSRLFLKSSVAIGHTRDTAGRNRPLPYFFTR